ncbi:MAG: transcription antitermination factor NusB [Myxococcota bacterium]|nr:transcription antitermination factor NusB [Myxococcota bacterium]
MVSARRVARETALLILFAVDMADSDDVDSTMALFWAHFPDDEEVLEELFATLSPDTLLTQTLSQAKYVLGEGDHTQREFVERLVRGVAAHSSAIDELIGRYSLNWKVARMGQVDRNILRLAAFELAFESDVPTKATLNEAIEIAKRFGTDESGKFVNGILDRIAQELGQV